MITASSIIAIDAPPPVFDGPQAARHLRWRLATTEAQFDALAPDWQRLHAAMQATAFQSFEWQRLWWRHFAADDPHLRLRLLVAEEEGEVVAIAPFMLETRRLAGIFERRRLGMLGEGITDYLDVLIAPGRESRVCQALAQHLADVADWDWISLPDVPDGSPLRRHLVADLLAHGLSVQQRVRVQCPRSALCDSWAKTLAGFGTEHRRKLTFLDRRLRKNFKISLRRVAQATDLPKDIDAFIGMHQGHWNRLGHGGAFRDARMTRFIRELARAFQAKGWLHLAFLQVDGEDAAALLAWQLAGQLQIYLTGVTDHERASKYSPGTALYTYCIEQAIEEGVRTCDFLRGYGRYKYLLGGQDVPNWDVTVFRPRGLRSHLLYGAERWQRDSIKRLRALLHPLRRLRATRAVNSGAGDER